jgi:hypothetical protein
MRKSFLLAKEAEILPEDPILAFFIGKYRRQRGRYDEIYTKRFYAIRQKLGNRFTADLMPGEQADPTSASPCPKTDSWYGKVGWPPWHPCNGISVAHAVSL